MAKQERDPVDEDGDVIMSDSVAREVDKDCKTGTVQKKPSVNADGAENDSEVKNTEENRDESAKLLEDFASAVKNASLLKEEGNALLKSGDSRSALEKYTTGILILEPVMDCSDVDAEAKKGCVLLYIALRLNSAQACLNQCDWINACEHVDRVLAKDQDNCKALYRRASAAIQLDSESRLEQAVADFGRVARLDPSNRKVREELASAKEKLKQHRENEKRRMQEALTGGGLYKEHHAKFERQRFQYEEEVKRRKEAGEDDIAFEDWLKKEKEEEEARQKKAKEERELAEEKRRWKEDCAKRLAEGIEELTFDAWREAEKKKPPAAPKTINEVVHSDDLDLNEEERKTLSEIKQKGYYHGRLGTVLSNNAPKPQRVEEGELAPTDAEQVRRHGSEWNQAGTWEEQDATVWAKEKLTSCLKHAAVLSESATLASGKVIQITAKVSDVKSLQGDAQIVVVHLKKKHGYLFETTTYSGIFSIPELMDSVQPQDLQLTTSWKRLPSAEYSAAVSECVGKLQDRIRDQVANFREEYAGK